MHRVALIEAAWQAPEEVLCAFADEPWALALLSGGGGPRGRWSYLARRPLRTLTIRPEDPGDAFAELAALLGPTLEAQPEGPPFQGGLAGLMSYELGARLESAGHPGHPDWPQLASGLYPAVLAFDHQDRRIEAAGELRPVRMAGVAGRFQPRPELVAHQPGHPDWPQLACGLYPAVLAFDHQDRRVVAVGRGASDDEAEARARGALKPLAVSAPAAPDFGAPLSDAFEAITPGETYEHTVAEVVRRIGEGEIFQANAARAWGGRLRPGVRPIDLMRRLQGESPAPFGAYFRLPQRAVVSNSPERFVRVSAGRGLRVETRPIKGTRPRGADAEADEALRQELLACEKDRAENLMIVDLMRNDLSRVCPPGTVEVTELFKLETFKNVHHLVSAVTGRLADGLKGLDLLEAAFPPGSITGAPKVQAIKVIADYEGPRGPYCGSMFWAGLDGAADSSVLIRTVALTQGAAGWRYEARAGAGIVADSDPRLERLETEAKIDAIRRALLGESA